MRYASSPLRLAEPPLANTSAPPPPPPLPLAETHPGAPPPPPLAETQAAANKRPREPAPSLVAAESRADTPEWQKVEAWLRSSAGVVLQYELKAAKAAFKQAGLATLVKVSRLTAPAVNKMQLSFDLRLRLLSAARELHKTLTFSGVNTSVLSTNDGEDSVEL